MSETWFVTGSQGCIGASVVHQLVQRGERVLAYDLGDDRRRLQDLMDAEALGSVEFVQGDVTDGAHVLRTLERSGASRMVHLAGLQVPFCAADPVKGAAVNVLGTLNVFEAVKSVGLPRLTYASSAAVYGPFPPGSPPPDESAPCVPLTHYGVFKCANEGNARLYADSVSSIGLRPLTVYGPGRDQGMTSDPTRAMKAAMVGRAFRIRFSGSTDMQFVPDVAAAFIAAAEGGPDGAHAFNVHGEAVSMARVHELLREHLPDGAEGIVVDGPELPLPPELDGRALAAALPGLPSTSFEDGLAQTLAHFRQRLDEGRLDVRELDD